MNLYICNNKNKNETIDKSIMVTKSWHMSDIMPILFGLDVKW